jgi:type 1 glutamine amidotransferase
MKKALVVYGGWDGHEPVQVSQICEAALKRNGFEVEMSDTLDAYCDGEKLKKLNLIVQCWTMGSIKREQLEPLLAAVRSGVGFAGCHGGTGDSFRQETEFQFMVGGQWVAHPGNDGRLYTVNIIDQNAITAGLKDFDVRSEKYYMHVDPAIRVMATTSFEDYGDALMPVTWTKTYGAGRVFYTSLGHHADILAMPPALQMMERGMLWAAGEGETEIGLPFSKVYCK